MSIVLNGTAGITTPDLDTDGLTSNGIDDNATSTAMTLDSSGNLLVGGTGTAPDTSSTDTGHAFRADGRAGISRDGGPALSINRLNSDGSIVEFRKDGSVLGSIGVATNITIGSGSTRIWFKDDTNSLRPISTAIGNGSDGVISLGEGSGGRFKDLYLSGGVYLGGTGAANKLEDYEEGGYNATFTTQNGSINLSGSQNRMNYTKIGRQVTITGRVVVASVSNPSGYVRFSLPFTNVSESEDEGHTALNVITYNVSGIGSNVLFAEVGPNTAYAILLKSVENSGWAYLNANGFSANDIIYVNGTYLTDA